MTQNFTETAPGVHTATLLHPKTGQRFNVAIIESCEKWQLFIDGELAIRDLPSFKAAVEQAEKKLTRKPGILTRPTVLAFSALSVAVVIGSAILIPLGDSASATSNMKSAAAKQVPTTFQRVRPSPPAAATSTRLADSATARPAAAVSRSSLPESGPLSRPVATVKVIDTPAPIKTTAAPIAVSKPAQDAPRRFSAENNLAALEKSPSTKPAADRRIPEHSPANKLAAEPTSPASVDEPPLQPVIISASPVRPVTQRHAEPVTAPAAPVASIDNNLAPTLVEATEVNEVGPPLPIRAPVYARPLIRSLNLVTERPKLNDLFARIEEEETSERDVNTQSKSPGKTAATAKPKRSQSARLTRHRNDDEAAPRRRSRRALRKSRPNPSHRSERRRYHTAENDRPARSRHMTCFAHVCRFR